LFWSGETEATEVEAIGTVIERVAGALHAELALRDPMVSKAATLAGAACETTGKDPGAGGISTGDELARRTASGEETSILTDWLPIPVCERELEP
jgi:hypothetical protein